MALPEVGLQAVLEGVDEFERGAKTIADSMRLIAQGSQTLAKESSQAAEQTGSAFDQMAQLMSLGALQNVAGTAGQVGNQLLGMAKAATLTAARAEELDAVLVNLAEQNDLSAGAMRGQVTAIKEQGITTAVASNLVSQFVRSNLDLEKASKLARIAQDAAVISMEDSSQALSGLLHGVLTLQPEILRYRGIIVDLQGEYTRWVQANNRAVQSLTGAEKQMIALDAVIAEGASITGTYESAMGTASKQIRSFSRYIEELQEDFGQALLPVFTEAVFTAKDFTKALMALPEPLKASIAMTGALTGGLLKGTSAMVGFGAQIAQIAVALNALNISLKATSLAILGPAGLVVALTAIVGVGIISAMKANEAANRAAAVAILEAADSYDEYVAKAESAGLSSYVIEESLYGVVKSAGDAKDAVDALAATEAWAELREQLAGLEFGITVLDEAKRGANKLALFFLKFENTFRGMRLEDGIAEFDNLTLSMLASEESARALGEQINLTGDRLEEFIDWVMELAQEQIAARQEMQLFENRIDSYTTAQDRADAVGRRLAEALSDLNIMSLEGAEGQRRLEEGILEMAEAAIAANPAVAALAEELEKIIAKGGDPLQHTIDQFADVTWQAAEQMLAAEEKAAEDREKARAKLMDSLTDLEEDHADRVADILQEMAETDADLLDDMAQAEQRFHDERLALEQQYADEIAEAERDLAAAQVEARRSLIRDLEDLERKYAQRREDEARDLARDLEDIERDLVKAQEGVWADYYAEM